MPNHSTQINTDTQLLTRNTVDCLPAGELANRLTKAASAGKPLRVKLGIDPTAPDVHLGHTVVLQKLREFQELGHTVVLIIGDFTAAVGDPSGRSQTRPLLSREEIEHNAATYQEQAGRVLYTDARLEIRRNSEWLNMQAAELFRVVRSATVAQVLGREDFTKRWQAQEPISLLELLYPVLQGYDSVAVKADVEVGGTDQTFNLLMGRDLQAANGQRSQIVMTLPLLVGTDGVQKMSKSYGNQVALTDSAEDMYGKTMRIPDAVMGQWYTLLLGVELDQSVAPRDAKRALARALVERFHGPDDAARAEAHFDRLFIARDLPEEVQEAKVAVVGATVHLPELITDLFGGSRSEARRKLAQGAVKLDGEQLAGDELDLPVDRLNGRVLQVGKRQFRRLRLVP